MKTIPYLFTPPKDVYIAFSGGIDSMVLLHSAIRKKLNVQLLHVHHNDEYSDTELEFAKEQAKLNRINLLQRAIPIYDRSTSKECFWSNHRNDIFQKLDLPVLTGHHLTDATEWYVMSSMQGLGKYMEPVNRNVLRPFITTPKSKIVEYANTYKLTYLTDPTNQDSSFNLRNKVRNELMGSLQNCFPGIETTVRKQIIKKYNLSKAK